MPRVPRIQAENAIYYVTSRGDNNEDIFKEGSDYAMYLDLLKKCKEQLKFKLFAFCLLSNHLHLLIEPKGDTAISQIMHSLNSNYTKYFNSRYSKKGHLFQERYKMVLIEKEPNLLNITGFIHLNPVALNIASRIDEYPYSSLPAYLNCGRQGGSIINMEDEIKEVLKYLKEKKYQDFVAAMPKDLIASLSGDLNKKAIMGSDEFIEKVKAIIENQKAQAKEAVEGKAFNNRRFILISGGVILLLGIFTMYFYGKSLTAREKLKKEMETKNAEISKRVVEEGARIRHDLKGKYKADMVSYQAMSKRLEIEKKKISELEEKLKTKKK